MLTEGTLTIPDELAIIQDVAPFTRTAATAATADDSSLALVSSVDESTIVMNSKVEPEPSETEEQQQQQQQTEEERHSAQSTPVTVRHTRHRHRPANKPGIAAGTSFAAASSCSWPGH